MDRIAPTPTEYPTPTTPAALIAGVPRFWFGPSGELVSGASVAAHLEATLALLSRDGWVRDYEHDSSTPDLNVADDASTKSMLRQLLALARDVFGSGDKRLTLTVALYRARSEGAGDDDTWAVAIRILEAILRARTGALTARYDAWAGKLGRTEEQVVELLGEAVTLARQTPSAVAA